MRLPLGEATQGLSSRVLAAAYPSSKISRGWEGRDDGGRVLSSTLSQEISPSPDARQPSNVDIPPETLILSSFEGSCSRSASAPSSIFHQPLQMGTSNLFYERLKGLPFLPCHYKVLAKYRCIWSGWIPAPLPPRPKPSLPKGVQVDINMCHQHQLSGMVQKSGRRNILVSHLPAA